jgi:four helix bundle protein
LRTVDQSTLLKDRTKSFALHALDLPKVLPLTEPGPTIRRQVTKAATSVAANYRASRRARSRQEFTARISMVAEEADETVFWREIIKEARIASTPALTELLHESRELCAIFSAMVRTARQKERARR